MIITLLLILFYISGVREGKQLKDGKKLGFMLYIITAFMVSLTTQSKLISSISRFAF